MTPQEREMIEGLFQRLKATDVPEKDKEAEQLIQARMAALPSAAYQLVQTVLVQEHALAAAQARIEQLESASRAPQTAGAGTSFLGGLLGRNRWNTQGAPEPAAAQPAPRSSVPITAPGPAPAAGFGGGGFGGGFGGGSFLGTALTTAAGVAGGALLFDGLRNLLGHNPGPFGPYVGGSGGLEPGGNVYETVNNYYGDDTQRDDHAIDTSDPNSDLNDGLQNADYDPSDDSLDPDPGGDFGNNDDV
jgi:uncharacterized protein